MRILIVLAAATLAEFKVKAVICDAKRETWTDQYQSKCLECMCQEATGCNLQSGCEFEITSSGRRFQICGPYQISEKYWIDAGGPGWEELGGFEGCSRNKTCSDETIIEFNRRYAKDCNHDDKYDCTDWALIYQGGIDICDKPLVGRLPGYWYDVTKCMSQAVGTVEPSEPASGTTSPQDASRLTAVPHEPLQKCLDCICQAATNCTSSYDCSEEACGVYKISKKFWEDAGSPHKSEVGDFARCAKHKTCSENTIIRAANSYGKDCDGNGEFDCLDIGLIHQGGVDGCGESTIKLTQFWKDYTKCLG